VSFPIDEINIYTVRLELKEPFRVSFGTVENRNQILIEVKGQGISGWGESAVLPFPFYNAETTTTALHILEDYAIPLFFKTKPSTPEAAHDLLNKIVGNHIAKAGLEMAYWDWHAKRVGLPLYRFLGGTKTSVPVGVSLPIYDDAQKLLERASHFLGEGYQKIKIKIGPGNDRELVKLLKSRIPSIPLMIDANSAYTLDDINLFRELDEYDLMMIEQPLREGDLFDHAELQRQIKNPLCLDESIVDVHDARDAAQLKSCKIINIKTARVGGHTEAKRIHDLAASRNIGVWCGGMLETGIGRAHNIAIATLPNFVYPNDISASDRYYERDIITAPVTVTREGTIRLTEKPGIGYDVDSVLLQKLTTRKKTFVAQ